ncbi:MAG TPA: hypothetical protein V6C89_00570 [Drouetiella sp.]|jgi:hypothetical protein
MHKQVGSTAVILALALALQGCTRLRDLFVGNHPATGSVTVSVEAPKIEVKYLDGIYWPQGKACGRAYTFWSFMCRPDFQLEPVSSENAPHMWVYKVTGVSIKTELPLRTWLPFGVKDKLRAHEEAHIKMCEEIYKSAGEIATQCGKEMMGRHIRSTAPDQSTALENARTEATRTFDAAYRQKMEIMADRAGVAFDRITNHGMNEVPEALGMKQAFDECKKSAPDVQSEKSSESPASEQSAAANR